MDIAVSDNPATARYEARVGDELAGLAAYRLVGGSTMLITHTEVLPAYEGRGIGGTLVAHALEDARGRGLRVRPLCSFVRSYVDRHPEYQDLMV